MYKMYVYECINNLVNCIKKIFYPTNRYEQNKVQENNPKIVQDYSNFLTDENQNLLNSEHFQKKAYDLFIDGLESYINLLENIQDINEQELYDILKKFAIFFDKMTNCINMCELKNNEVKILRILLEKVDMLNNKYENIDIKKLFKQYINEQDVQNQYQRLEYTQKTIQNSINKKSV